MDYFAAIMLMLTGIFLILLVLIQRGRGGGLAGAFGGMGGQSAFGTKAGDVFTKITVVAAVVWVLLAGACIWVFSANSSGNFQGGEDVAPGFVSGGDDQGAGAGAGGSDEGEQQGDTQTTNGGSDSEGDNDSSSSEDSSESSESSE